MKIPLYLVAHGSDGSISIKRLNPPWSFFWRVFKKSKIAERLHGWLMKHAGTDL